MNIQSNDIVLRQFQGNTTMWLSERYICNTLGSNMGDYLRIRGRLIYRQSVSPCFRSKDILPDTGKAWRYARINGQFYYDFDRIPDRKDTRYRSRLGERDELLHAADELATAEVRIAEQYAIRNLEDYVTIVQADAVYGAKFTFNWLSAGGTAILLSGLVSVPFMPKYGYGKAIACFMRTLKQLTFPILTIAMILGLAYLMNYSGMSSTLGLAFTHTGWLFPFFSPLLGWLGVFLTGSDTSSCALFGGMQKDTALAVGMRPELAVASNASGGVTAKMISPQSLSVATAATNNAGQEGIVGGGGSHGQGLVPACPFALQITAFFF